MWGKCSCGRNAQLRKGKCLKCYPYDPVEQKAKFEKKLAKFKGSKEQKAVNAKFRKYPKYSIKKIKPSEPREIDVMFEKWQTTEHASFINGETLRYFEPSKIAHVLPKGSYPKWKNKKFNMVLMTEGQHYQQHNTPKSDLEKKLPGWKRFFALQDHYRILYQRGEEPLTTPEDFVCETTE